METSAIANGRTKMNGKPVYGLPAKQILNLKSGFKHKLLCDGPTFSCGFACTYGCTFCYVPEIYRKHSSLSHLIQTSGLKHGEVVVRRERPIEILQKEMVRPNGEKRFSDPNDNRVVFTSPAVDPAANMELVVETIEACRVILESSAWQIRILSKSNLLPKVAQALGDFKSRVIYGVSTGTLDDKLAAAFEKGTPLVSKRLESLRWLQDNGYRTFGMICPSLPQKNEKAYAAFAQAAFQAIRGDKCEHVWAEVINARGESFDQTVSALNAGGFQEQAVDLAKVRSSRPEWEEYNRQTFLAHAAAYKAFPGKLRYLTYVTASTREWWHAQITAGAVVL